MVYGGGGSAMLRVRQGLGRGWWRYIVCRVGFSVMLWVG